MTTQVYLEGKVKWAKVHKPDDKYGNYQINLYMTPESQKVFDGLKLGLKDRKDDDGNYVTFRRPQRKLIKDELVEFGPPKVLKVDEEGNAVETKELIGNGSDVSVRISVYETQKGKAHRLEAVLVRNLVPFAGGGEVIGVQQELPF